jgi:hypothetical protein
MPGQTRTRPRPFRPAPPRPGVAVFVLPPFAGTLLDFLLAAALRAAQEAWPAKSTIRAKSILGATVNITGDASVGTVEDIVFTDEGVVDYLVVGKDGKLVTLPWDAAKFDYEERQATVGVTRTSTTPPTGARSTRTTG